MDPVGKFIGRSMGSWWWGSWGAPQLQTKNPKLLLQTHMPVFFQYVCSTWLCKYFKKLCFFQSQTTGRWLIDQSPLLNITAYILILLFDLMDPILIDIGFLFRSVALFSFRTSCISLKKWEKYELEMKENVGELEYETLWECRDVPKLAEDINLNGPICVDECF